MAIVSDHDQRANHPHTSPGTSAPLSVSGVDPAAVGAFLRAVTETAAAAGARAAQQSPILLQVTPPAVVQPAPRAVPGHPGVEVTLPPRTGAAFHRVRTLRERLFGLAFTGLCSGCAAVAIALGTHSLRPTWVWASLGAWVVVGAVSTIAAGAALAPEPPSALGTLAAEEVRP